MMLCISEQARRRGSTCRAADENMSSKEGNTSGEIKGVQRIMGQKKKKIVRGYRTIDDFLIAFGCHQLLEDRSKQFL